VVVNWVFSNRVLCTRFHGYARTDYGTVVPLFFSADGGKKQATRSAGGRGLKMNI
jgi:hypothetical protein